MNVFEIRDNAQKKRLLGYLFHYEKSGRFFAELLQEVDEWTCPFVFSGAVKKGIYSIDSLQSRRFVEQRIIPADRQNLGSILKENGLKEYDAFRLLQLSEGRCAQDEIYLAKCSEKDLLPEMQKRLTEKVLDVLVMNSGSVLVFFRDGLSVMADVKELCGGNRTFENVLRREELFRRIHVSPGGHGVEWGEERFLPAEILRKEGKTSALSYEALTGFVQERLADTSEFTEMLHCSRQYVKQLADKKRLVPLREGGNWALYPKSSVEAEDYSAAK